ncbi:hypothetical protein EYC84_010186 [Monilinia fructicola]|uniref:Uncharacterized protein n=1 Tax=Monilinia fructicola TaxID=38448 RepID=A0A5M9JGM4_MONFR|nr:hypothetical protein EYC84_010186 [Monilinia fructicola]
MTSYRLKYTAIAIPLHASQCSSRLQDFIIESVDTTPSLALPVTSRSNFNSGLSTVSSALKSTEISNWNLIS